MKRRILHELDLNEISGVDRPCQAGAVVAIMKRAPVVGIEALSARLTKLKAQVAVVKAFNPSQARAKDGKWSKAGAALARAGRAVGRVGREYLRIKGHHQKVIGGIASTPEGALALSGLAGQALHDFRKPVRKSLSPAHALGDLNEQLSLLKAFTEADHPRANNGEFTDGGSDSTSSTPSKSGSESTTLKWANTLLTAGLVASIGFPAGAGVAAAAFTAMAGASVGTAAVAGLGILAAETSLSTVAGLSALKLLTGKLIDSRKQELAKAFKGDAILATLTRIRAELASHKPK